ncbi:MAG: RAMP superfamily CRISPR-associated protein [candidate division KSB1 bacterium]
MRKGYLQILLLSDTTFGRGDGVAGLVDAEVQHDEYGLPYLGGRALKGMLAAESADLLSALKKSLPSHEFDLWNETEDWLFGKSGAALMDEANLRISAARLPEDLRLALAHEVQQKKLKREEILETLTTLRRQTAMDAASGAPKKEALRTSRVILRNLVFEAALDFAVEPPAFALPWLAACVKAFRHAGTGRNRGRGLIHAELLNENRKTEPEYFQTFKEKISPQQKISPEVGV